MKKRQLTLEERWEEDNKIYLELHIKERLFPCLLGGIIGDALGVPVEFKSRGFKVTDMIGNGTYNQPLGTWSDDTSLTFCLIENLIEEKDLDKLMEKFVKYQEEGYWTPYGKMFDVGRTTVEAIQRFKNGVPAIKCGGTSEYDNGNGALMRIAPIAFLLCYEKDFNKRVIEVESVAEITHAHPRSTLGCIIYIEILIGLYHNNKITTSINDAIDNCLKELKKNNKYKNEIKHYKRIFDKSIFNVSIDKIISDGYVVNSLEASIWCLLKNNNYKDSVLEAVNLGEDTDTIAFITGTMAGAYYKMEQIPDVWIRKLARFEDLVIKINDFYEFCCKKLIK